MRWMREPEPRPCQKRTITFLAWWPYRIAHETRWLERVTVAQVGQTSPYRGVPNYWDDVRFVDP